jgi:23S rRNA A1618 N6-methylase RlmF
VSKNKYGEYKIDWTDPHAVRELTKVLLDHDFGIKIELPIDRLCPTVTLRMNYILWLQDLMKPHILAQLQQSNAIPSIRGIDIGTGASCIYPLLGVATNNWNFVATEIDDVSLVWAQKNIALNQWQHKIELRKPPPNSILLHIVYPNEQFDFCMCNPPFFASSEEKFVNPHTVCTATESEMSTAGGELAFVSQIIQESLTLRERVRWYTSMIGRKVNVKALLTELHKHQMRVQSAHFLDHHDIFVATVSRLISLAMCACLCRLQTFDKSSSCREKRRGGRLGGRSLKKDSTSFRKKL